MGRRRRPEMMLIFLVLRDVFVGCSGVKARRNESGSLDMDVAMSAPSLTAALTGLLLQVRSIGTRRSIRATTGVLGGGRRGATAAVEQQQLSWEERSSGE
ncbi:unnamed protein product [Sphagnum balticum]